MIRLSLENYLATATISSVTSEAAGWPASNTQQAHRPFIHWRSTSTVQQDMFFNLGSAKVMKIFLAINVNFTGVELFADNDGTYSPTNFTAGSQVISRNAWNTRYTLAYLFPSDQTLQYFLVRIANQATTDGASYFSAGGFWLGTLTNLPDFGARTLRVEETITKAVPKDYLRTLSGGMQTLLYGRPRTILTYRRYGDAWMTGAASNAVKAWLELDRTLDIGTHVAWYLDRGDTSDAWIVRKTNESTWQLSPHVGESELVLEESIGP